MQRLKSIVLGTFDGLLPAFFSVYLNPLYGNLSNFHAFVNHYTLESNYSIFFTTFLFLFLFLHPIKHAWYYKYSITLFTPLLLKYLGYHFLSFKFATYSSIPDGVVYMLVTQFILLTCHYFATVKYIHNKFLYWDTQKIPVSI